MNEIINSIKHLYHKEISHANLIECTAGTNGYKGGDSGYGSRTYFSIEDLSSTDMKVRITKNNEVICDCDLMGGKIEIGLGGDSELSTFAEAIEYALNVYEKEIKNDEEV